jgi:hypothetical protein
MKMSAGVVAVLVVLCGGFIVGGMACSEFNKFTRLEKALTAQLDSNKNELANYSNGIAEAVQVPAMYRDDFLAVVKADTAGTFGQDGSKATLQFLTQHDIKLDAKLYEKIEDMIAVGRESFKARQNELLDKKRVYETELGIMPGAFFASMMGFPKIDMSKILIVTTDSVERAFTTGKAEPLKLR